MLETGKSREIVATDRRAKERSRKVERMVARDRKVKRDSYER